MNLFYFLLLFYVLMSFLGVMMVLSSPSPMVMWVGMEISTFFFLPIFIMSKPSSLSAWKYFIIQGLSSFFFFWGWVVGELQTQSDFALVFISMMIKLSGFPFYGWVIHLSENLSWSGLFLLGSLQKIAPLIILSKVDKLSSTILLLCIFSLITLTMFFFTDFSIRWMMMFSSLFNITWLIVSSVMSSSSLLIYMTIYFVCNMVGLGFLSSESFDSFSSSFKARSVKWGENLQVILLFLFLMGVPPMGTFLGKVEVLLQLIMSDMMIYSLIIVLCSAIIMYFYFKITYHKGMMSSKLWLDHFSYKWVLSMFFLISPFLMFFWV